MSRTATTTRSNGFPLILGEDVGGLRHFIDGQPVHCGDTIEVQFVGDTPVWLPVRYEASFDHQRGEISAWLHVAVATSDGYYSQPSFKAIENAFYRWPAHGGAQ